MILKDVYKLDRRCFVVVCLGFGGGSLEKRGTFHDRQIPEQPSLGWGAGEIALGSHKDPT